MSKKMTAAEIKQAEDQRVTYLTELLKESTNNIHETQGIIILVLKKDGSQAVQSSLLEKPYQAFLVSLANSWVHTFFRMYPSAGVPAEKLQNIIPQNPGKKK